MATLGNKGRKAEKRRGQGINTKYLDIITGTLRDYSKNNPFDRDFIVQLLRVVSR